MASSARQLAVSASRSMVRMPVPMPLLSGFGRAGSRGGAAPRADARPPGYFRNRETGPCRAPQRRPPAHAVRWRVSEAAVGGLLPRFDEVAELGEAPFEAEFHR